MLIVLVGSTLLICWLCSRSRMGNPDRSQKGERIPGIEDMMPERETRETPGFWESVHSGLLRTVFSLAGAAIATGLLIVVLWFLFGRSSDNPSIP